jgi:hypothetical protein
MKIAQHILVALTATATLLILFWFFKYSAYGIEFTDEGFYLNWILNPFSYDVSASQFGFVYHPLYELLGGNIAALRRTNGFVLFGLAYVFVYIFLTSLAPESKAKPVILNTVAAGLATSVFIFFTLFLLTPNYNSLALQSLLVTGIGLLLAEQTTTRRSIFGWVMIGLGGWLAFMAKPTTALALSVGFFLYLLLSRKFSVRLLLLAIATAASLLLASALLIDGSLPGFIKRLQLSVEFASYLDSGHTLSHSLRLDGFQLTGKIKGAIFVFCAATFFSVWGAWAQHKRGWFVCLSISFVFFAMTAMLIFGQTNKLANPDEFRGFLIFGAVYAAILAGVVLCRVKSLKAIEGVQWAIASLFLVMPYIFAFGTGNNYWPTQTLAGIFWLLAGVSFLSPLARERKTWLFALPLALATQTLTAVVLHSATEKPYRQSQPFWLNDSTLQVGQQNSTLVLSDEFAQYINNAVATAQHADFKRGTPMIDLSGQSPGILYVLGAESIGSAWFIGGYPGSLKLAKAQLDRVSCEKIAVAWVLLEPNGRLSISAELMGSFGADFPASYEQAGAWQTAAGAGGDIERRTQQLYRPIRAGETLKVCQALRNEGAQ